MSFEITRNDQGVPFSDLPLGQAFTDCITGGPSLMFKVHDLERVMNTVVVWDDLNPWTAADTRWVAFNEDQKVFPLKLTGVSADLL